MLNDLRYAVRMLAKSPRFAVAAVLTLALGIGANSAVFSVVNAVLLRPLPYPHPDRIMTLWQTSVSDGRDHVSGPNYLDWQEQSRSFDSIAAVIGDDPTLTGRGEPVRLDVSQVSAGFFPTMGVAPVLGRGLLPADDRRGTERVVVVGHGLWRERLGGRETVLGESLVLDGKPHRVVGVMPAGFEFPRAADAWVPLAISRANTPGRGDSILRVVGRLRVGVTPRAAQAEMEGIARRLEQAYPESNSGQGVTVVPLRELLVGGVRSGVLALLGAVAFVLLIACANVANLLLAQALRRRSEIALRVALGAGRLRIARQLVTESLMIAALGAVSGLAVAWGALRLLVRTMPSELPRVGEIDIDGRVLVFTLVAALTSGILFGLVPALQTARDLQPALWTGGRGMTPSRWRFGAALVVTEIALTFVLVIGAGLFIRSLASLQSVDPGFDPSQVLTAGIDLPRSRFPDASGKVRFYREIVERIEATPGVRSVGLTTTLPLTGSDLEINISIPGRPVAQPGQGPSAGFNAVTEGYFRTMRIALRAGREFTRVDDEHAAPVIIVSEGLARRHWPEESPVGKRLTVGGVLGWPDIEREIVGVVRDVHHDGLNAAARAEMYVPYAQMPWPFASIVVRSTGDPRAVAAGVRGALAAADKSLAPSGFRSMESIVARSIAEWRFRSLLLGVFGAVALALACVGLHGVVSQTVAQRTREIGVRMALGATSRGVAGMFVWRSVLMAVAGVAAGVPIALAVTRMIRSHLFGIEPNDPITMAGAAGLLLAVAILSAWLPARRAAKVDPMVALRCE